MRLFSLIVNILVIVLNACTFSHATSFLVNTQLEFNTALSQSSAGDTIAWESGWYEDIYMNINKSNLVITAEELGETKFTGASKVFISGSHATLKGFQFIDGDIGTSDVIKTSGSYNTFTQLNIQGYRSYKYLVIRAECLFNTVSFCNFENRLNLDDKNILSVLVDNTNPGYHLIYHCSFKNFDGTGGDLGIEPIRIGLSTQGEFISRTTVEYCYFTQCSGDGEIISNKARQNVFRYNTFENNPRAELVLRHGAEAVVYSNFFLNNYGGIRIREGQDHVIYNNYFSGMSSRSMILQNDPSDPLDNITIAYNTFVETEEIRLGGQGGNPPQHVILVNNIFSDPKDDLFSDATGSEEWIGNIAFGSLGIPSATGLQILDPDLDENIYGFYELSAK
jgi:hypothetical protein